MIKGKVYKLTVKPEKGRAFTQYMEFKGETDFIVYGYQLTRSGEYKTHKDGLTLLITSKDMITKSIEMAVDSYDDLVPVIEAKASWDKLKDILL